jgi:SAM-dependent methyltransferase
LEAGEYDFLDFGCGSGESIRFGERHFRARHGLGIEIDGQRAALGRAQGLQIIEGDITQVDIPADSVSFVSIMDVLSLLSDRESTSEVLARAGRAARDVIFIRHPDYSHDGLLETLDLRFTWSGWKAHTNRLLCADLERLFGEHGWHDFIVVPRNPIFDTLHSSLVPHAVRRNAPRYNPEIHPPKTLRAFHPPLYTQMDLLVRVNPDPENARWLSMRRAALKLARAPLRRAVSLLPLRVRAMARRRRPALQTPDRPGSIDELIKRLMLHRGWNYLRYLHMREGFKEAKDIRTVLGIGCGRGYAELALALEFPEVEFTLTELPGSEMRGILERTGDLVDAWEIDNVKFGDYDLMNPPDTKYDLVMSVEVLEHLEDDARAAAAMRSAANRYVFVLVPFADSSRPVAEDERQRLLQRHGHYRPGYDAEALRALFPGMEAAKGC